MSSSLPNRPAFIYADGELVLSWPARPMIPREVGIGSRAISAVGLPATFEVRRDYFGEITLRYMDSERAALFFFLRWAQRSVTPFTFRLDFENGPEHLCYLHQPEMGDEIAEMKTEFPRMNEITILLRSMSGPFNPFYWGQQ